MTISLTDWQRQQQLEAAGIMRRREEEAEERKKAAPPPSPGISLADYIRGAWEVLEPKTPYVHNWHIDAMAEHLTAVSRGEIQYLVINIPPRHMKPVDEDTLVLMANGRRRRLAEIREGDPVISHNGRPCRVEGVHIQGDLPVLRIETHSGRVVRAAPDHPFLTPTGWVQARNLVEGDTLAAVVPETAGSSDRPLEEFRLAGYYVGDGNTTASGKASCQSNITCHDIEQAADIIHCAETLGFEVNESTAAKGRYHISAGSRDWLRQVGLARKSSWTKRVPLFVFEGDGEQVANFLGAYFACDGTLNQRGHERADLCVTYNSVNRDLLEDIQHLLLRLGVRSRIRRHVARHNNYTGGKYISWRLSITSQNDTAKFVSRIPVYGGKARRLAEWGIKRTEFDSHLIPDPIVSIEPDGTAACRCLTVEDDHSFLANDIAVHNSLGVSVFWPTWEWTWWPESRWLTASYGQGLAIRDALKSRRLIQSRWYQERWGNVFRLTGDQNQKMRYENDKRGYRIATSVGGTGTGEGGDRILVDDPLKREEADSDAKRERANLWWDQTMSTRGNDPETAAWIVICQRLHEMDLPGYIMERMKRDEEDYELLIIPAEYEPPLYTTLLGLEIEANEYETSLGWSDPRTEPGELIWPDRFPRSHVERLKKKLGSMGTAAQLQQHPAPAEGALFKDQWWRFWVPAGADLPPVRIKTADGSYIEAPVVELPEDFDEQLQSWDMAFKDMKDNDYVVGQVWAKKAADRFLLDQDRGRMDIVKTLKAVRDMTGNWPLALAKLVEDKANGPAVVQLLKSEIPGLIEVTPEGGKVSRANAVLPMIEAGNVFLPHPHVAPWVHDYLTEFRFFPVGAHDDQVDATSQALRRWLPDVDDEEPAAGEAHVVTADQLGL